MPKLTRWRSLVGFMAAAVLFSGVNSSVAQATEVTNVYTFVPLRLTVFNIQDDDVFPWTDWQDEPRMYYGNAVWADNVLRGGYAGTIDPVDFTGTSMRVDLWERDRNFTDNEHLGGETVTTAQLDQELTLKFQGNWWHYELTYKVVPN